MLKALGEDTLEGCLKLAGTTGKDGGLYSV